MGRLTFKTTITNLLDTRSLFKADDVLSGLLVHGEVPERWVYLDTYARNAITALPDTPCDEDPDVPPIGQVSALIGAFLRGKPMIRERDYKDLDLQRGLWRWNTRTLRMGGMYLNRSYFVLVHLEYAKKQKADGRTIPQKAKEFSLTTRNRIQELGLRELAWITKDPHDGEA